MRITAILAFFLSLISAFQASAETWDIKLVLAVPRVYDNTRSQGYRKYQTQKLTGRLTVTKTSHDEPLITFCRLENLTHKVGGKPVTYDVNVDSTIWHGIGSNHSGVFDTRSVSICLIAEPSYALGDHPTEDNSLVITLSGKGKDGWVKGFASGQLGCGCQEYGHISPTRIWNTSTVVDTAGVYGKWKAIRIQ